MQTIRQNGRQILVDLARKHHIAYLAVFGSYARGDERPDSDIDLYVRFGRPITLFEMLGIKHEMEDALGCSVDLIAEELVEPYAFIRSGIDRDLTVLYDELEAHAAAQ